MEPRPEGSARQAQALGHLTVRIARNRYTLQHLAMFSRQGRPPDFEFPQFEREIL